MEMTIKTDSKSAKAATKSIVESMTTRDVHISIKITEMENLKFLIDEVAELKVVAKFMNDDIKCSPDGAQQFKPSDDVELNFEFQINAESPEEIFNLVANPVQREILHQSFLKYVYQIFFSQ